MAYTNTTLLDQIKQRAAIPISQNTFENQDILDLASEIIETELLPKILQAKQEFYVTYDDIATTKESSDNYAWIRIPSRAVGQSIISVCDPDDDTEIDRTDYWVEGSKIYFNEGVSSETFRIRYYLKPSKLVTLTSVATISAINSGTISVSAIPSDYTTADKYDFVRASPGYDSLAISKTCSSISSPDMSFTASDVPSELAVGDYVCMADESPVPQIPVEWFSYLAQLTAVQILESIGDNEAATVAVKRLARMEKNVLSLISPRVEKKSKAIIRAFDDYGSGYEY